VPAKGRGRGSGSKKKAGSNVEDGATVQEIAELFSLQQKVAWEMVQRLKHLGMISDRTLYRRCVT